MLLLFITKPDTDNVAVSNLMFKIIREKLDINIAKLTLYDDTPFSIIQDMFYIHTQFDLRKYKLPLIAIVSNDRNGIVKCWSGKIPTIDEIIEDYMIWAKLIDYQN